MRIGCLQFAPQVGDIDNNLNRADSVLSKANNTDDLDLLVLPELAFSGYNFKSLQQISPYLEPSGSGITSLWARTTALKYNCNVVVGYPEKVDVSSQWPTGPEYYNSAIVVNGDGETIANYRKNFLYYTDETWALEGGKGFYEGWIPGLGNTSIGICMDLNPYKFQAPWHAFEFAFHILEYESNLVVVSMAWMTREDGRLFSRMPNEPDMDTLTYWVTRLEPLIRAENEEEIIIVFCNRTGTEDDAVYAGTSAVVGIQDGEVKVYGLLGRGEKELLVIDTTNPPYAKLVYRPQPERPSAVRSELQKSNEPESSTSARTPSTSSQGGGSQQGYSTHTPTQPTSPPSKSSAASVSSTKSQNSQTSQRSHRSQSSQRSQAWQASSPVPLSGRSTHSVHSVNSVQSVQSENSVRSTSTVTSNPRPPEDSTPYPHSGAPLSGYPTRKSDKRIYGGSVSITHMPFTPITPFEDNSPLEPRYFWRPSDSLLKTPMESQESEPRSAVAEPDDTRTMSFHFPLFHATPPPPPRTHSSTSMRTVATAGSARKEVDRRGTPSQGGRVRNPSKSRSGDILTGRAGHTPTPSQEPFPARPSSPKSRNASRSRNHERSDSALAFRENANAISQQLESISHRAESRSRGVPEQTGTPQPDRPSSPKSRNCSRSRPSENLSSILIGASPSILSDEHLKRAAAPPPDKALPQRPMSRMNHHARAGSFSEVRPSSRGSVAGDHAAPRPASRAASRGRKPLGNFSPPKMSPHDPSLPQGQAPEELSRIERDRKDSIGSQPPPDSPASEPNFARIETVVCTTCPVHGRHSVGSAPDPSSISGHRVSPDSNTGRSMSSPAVTTTGEHTNITPTSNVADDPKFSATKSDNPSDVSSLAETVETISISSRSPSTPMFEPKTPKAMVAIRDTDAGADGRTLVPEMPAELTDLTCADRSVGTTPTPDAPRAIAT
ncbi:Protein N-terminal amidase [Colletotrichum fructicola Nara gc5]|uniref:Protein N-terminal amidase n=1 Tax=Colletotrichum fructicola (strain Nara gc5) TaxID=1213859 RepID=A0A7J6JJM5_COLFN|nr:Protein N-terminal amidase [Colletotrichum fructicola Nara gc5]